MPGPPGGSTRSTRSGGAGRRPRLPGARVHKLMLNFTWWVNRKDAAGATSSRAASWASTISASSTARPSADWRLHQPGRRHRLDGDVLAQPDEDRPRAGDARPCLRGHRHQVLRAFLLIAEAMTNIAGAEIGLWDEEDQFYYDELNFPDGRITPLRVRSMVGLMLFAVEVLEPDTLAKLGLPSAPEMVPEEPPRAARPGLALGGSGTASALAPARPPHEASCRAHAGRDRVPLTLRRARPLQVPRGQSLPLPLGRAGDQRRLPAGRVRQRPLRRQLELARADLVSGQLSADRIDPQFHKYYGDDFRVECPTGSGNFLNLQEVARELGHRLWHLPQGCHRPPAGLRRQREDAERPAFPRPRALLRVLPRRHGSRCRRLAQTGWTGLVAKLL